jgi:hypothetical protein
VKRSSLVFSSLMMLALGAGVVACGETEDALSDAGTGGSGSGGSGGSGGTGGGGGSGGSGGSGGTGGSSGSGGSAADAGGDGGAAKMYSYIAIFDNDKTPVCADSSGPGADIDSVELRRGSSNIGAGLVGSAMYSTQPGGTPCTMCGSMMTACAYSGSAAAARAEGQPNGKVMATGADIGYIALNAGVLWLQIGQANGNGPAQMIRSGDIVTVYEIDKDFQAQGEMYAPASCLCTPEKYTVFAYMDPSDATSRVQLVPTGYRSANTTACGATPSGNLGCGTTTFSVP